MDKKKEDLILKNKKKLDQHVEDVKNRQKFLNDELNERRENIILYETSRMTRVLSKDMGKEKDMKKAR